MKVNNAIIMAAGTSSRFAPLSYEKPKALIEVRGEILIERQIKQLQDAGIDEIVIVTGYKAEQFKYLEEKYRVILVHNPDYLTRNNNASIYVAKNYIKNTYICSADNYFIENPFSDDEEDSYYSAVYIKGDTEEWCITEENNFITSVEVGGKDSWIMLGHVFWSEEFSNKFIGILESEYNHPETANKLWETIYIEHINDLKMKVRKYPSDYIFEFDTLDELRIFDQSYINNTRSKILKKIATELNVDESEIKNVKSIKGGNNSAVGFSFYARQNYLYNYSTQMMGEIR